MTELYRLMIYFAHSTLVMYSKDIVSNDAMQIKEFRYRNYLVLKRVFDEGLSIMQYELSSEQIDRAIYVYLQSKYFPQSIKDTKTYDTNKT